MEIYSLIILAGGQARRLGGIDKGLLEVNGKPLAQHLAQRFHGAETIISANRHHERYRQWADQVVSDRRADFAGPLAGIEAALARCRQPRALIVPCDMPWLPEDLALRLFDAVQGPEEIAIAATKNRTQHLCMAMQGEYWRDNLSAFLDNGGRSVRDWLADKPVRRVQFGNTADFRNINRDTDIPGLT